METRNGDAEAAAEAESLRERCEVANQQIRAEEAAREAEREARALASSAREAQAAREAARLAGGWHRRI